MNKAIIKVETGEVINVIVPWTAPEGCVAIDQGELQIGDLCEEVDGQWVKKAV